MVLPLDYGISLEQDRLVCILDAVLERMDYTKLLHLYSVKGRNPRIPPNILFKIIVFAMAEGTYSLRGMAHQCEVNIEYIWLLQGYPAPSHMTIGRFFKRIPLPVLVDLFTQLVRILGELDSVDFQEWYIDGTKLEANANRYTFVWKKRILKGIQRLKQKRYVLQEALLAVTGMDTFTMDDDDLLGSIAAVCQKEQVLFVHGQGHRKTELQRLFEQTAAIREKQQEYDEHLRRMGTRNSYSKTDWDATFMRMKEDPMKNGQLKPAYNVQLAVQSEYIVGIGLFPNPTDTKTMIPFLTQLESVYGTTADTIVADAGYDSEENLDWLFRRQRTALIKPNLYERKKKKTFAKRIGRRENMEYDSATDTYRCAKGRRLSFVKEQRYKNRQSSYERHVRIYRCENCQYCGKRSVCQPARYGTQTKHNKQVQSNPHYNALLQRVNQEMNSTRGIRLRINRSIQVEGAFGVLKDDYRYRRIQRRGKEKVLKELLFVGMGFNLRKLQSRYQNGRIHNRFLDKTPKMA